MRKLKKIIFRVTFIITILIFLMFGVQGYQLNRLIKRVDEQIGADRKELEDSKKQLNKLENEITKMDTPEYIEKIAREELGMVKKDDIVFREKK